MANSTTTNPTESNIRPPLVRELENSFAHCESATEYCTLAAWVSSSRGRGTLSGNGHCVHAVVSHLFGYRTTSLVGKPSKSIDRKECLTVHLRSKIRETHREYHKPRIQSKQTDMPTGSTICTKDGFSSTQGMCRPRFLSTHRSPFL
jgi:hypothetical protein